MHKFASLLLTASCLLSGACARTPDVEVSYFLPRSDLALRAVRTVGCDSRDVLYSTTAVTAVTAFSRGTAPADRKSIRLKALDNPMSNTDWGVSFYEDGRLKGINATTVGKGDEIIKTAIQMAQLGVMFFQPPPSSPEACKLIRERSPKDGMLTLVYTKSESFADKIGRSEAMSLDAASVDHALFVLDMALRKPLCVNVGVPVQEEPWTAYKGNPTNDVNLALRQPARVKVAVIEAMQACKYTDEPESARPIWAGTVLVPQAGKPYDLPIPKGALFGKQSFELALAESGAVNSLKYGKETGGSGLLGVMNAGMAAIQPDTPAARAAEIKAEADLIAQQQRLIRCQTDPDNCV